MPITVEYASRRSEVWTLYWWMWRRGLWRSHLIAFVAVGAVVSLVAYHGIPPTRSGWIAVVAAALVLPALWVAYPQLRFKPQKRTLTISESGITTRIGHRSGTAAWDDLKVMRLKDAVILQRKRGNAFIVPARAFATPEAAQAFAREAERATA